jgi:hypothetical protein
VSAPQIGDGAIPVTTRLHEAGHICAAANLKVPFQKVHFLSEAIGQVVVNDVEGLSAASSAQVTQRYQDIHVIAAAGLYVDLRTGRADVRTDMDEVAIGIATRAIQERLSLPPAALTALLGRLDKMSSDFVSENWLLIESVADKLLNRTYDGQEISGIVFEAQKRLRGPAKRSTRR